MQAVNTEKKYDFGPKVQTNLNQRQTSQRNAPLKSFRSGAISVSIWENENLTQDGKVQAYKTVSFDRRYKDKNGEWKSTNSLRTNDLPKAVLILQKAYEYLILTGEDGADSSEY